MGKSALGVQLAQAAHERGSHVVWADCAGNVKLWTAISATLKAARLVEEGDLPPLFPSPHEFPDWNLLHTLAARLERLVIIVDNYPGPQFPLHDELVLTTLERLPNVHLILLGHDMGTLDAPLSRLRVSSAVIDDDMLQFTVGEVQELLDLKHADLAPDSNDAAKLTTQAAHIVDATAGWPLAVLGQINHGEASAGFAREFITHYASQMSPAMQELTRVACSIEEISPDSLASIAGVPEFDAARVLTQLSATFMRQRIDSNGTRWYSLQKALHQDIWMVIRPDNEGNNLHKGEASQKISTERAVALALRSPYPEQALQAAFAQKNWHLVNELLLRCTTISLVDPASGLLSLLSSIPVEAQHRYPILRYSILLPTVLNSGAPRPADALRAGEIAEVLNEVPHHQADVLTIAITAAKIHASRLQGDERTCVDALTQLQKQFDSLTKADLRRSWPTFATIACHAAVTHIALGNFSDAEWWKNLAITMTQVIPRTHGLSPSSSVYAEALGALISAARGDLRSAVTRVEEWERAHGELDKRRNFSTKPLEIAKAIVAFERNQTQQAFAFWRSLNERVRSLELRPFVIWLGAQLSAQRYGPAQAAKELSVQIRALKRVAIPMRGNDELLSELLARLSFLGQQDSPHPVKGSVPHLANAYAAFEVRQYARARSIARRVHDRAIQNTHLRRSVEALLCVEAADLMIDGTHVPPGPSQSLTATTSDSGRLARRLICDYGFVSSGLSASLRPLVSYDRITTPASNADDAVTAATGHSSSAQGSNRESTASPARTSVRRLTAAELRVLQSISVHGTAPNVARELNLSVHTVRDHLKSIYRKFDVSSRDDALHVAHQIGLLL
ncbi:response regulator transcription factor [Leucobacter sp. HY1910]